MTERDPKHFCISSILSSQGTADFRRKPQIFAENRRKPEIGLHYLGCVTFSSALIEGLMTTRSSQTAFGKRTQDRSEEGTRQQENMRLAWQQAAKPILFQNDVSGARRGPEIHGSYRNLKNY